VLQKSGLVEDCARYWGSIYLYIADGARPSCCMCMYMHLYIDIGARPSCCMCMYMHLYMAIGARPSCCICMYLHLYIAIGARASLLYLACATSMGINELQHRGKTSMSTISSLQYVLFVGICMQYRPCNMYCLLEFVCNINHSKSQ
jgi:hypothetical protein